MVLPADSSAPVADAVAPDAVPLVEHRRLRGWLGDLVRDSGAVLGVLFLGLVLLCALAAPLLAPHDPAAVAFSDRQQPPFWMDGGSWTHLLGTDNLGQDVLSRVIHGSRVSVVVGISVVVLAGLFGVTLGLVAGYKGGLVDSIIMRIVDTQIAFPGLLIVLMVLAFVGPSVGALVVVLAANGWMAFARNTRGTVLAAREAPYVEAAELVGCRPRRVIFRQILPNLASPLLTLAILEFARAVLAEAALSYLGLGVQPPQTSWGLDVATGKDHLFDAPWLMVAPGVAIALMVLSLNLVASWLRVVTDPHEWEKRYAGRMGRK